MASHADILSYPILSVCPHDRSRKAESGWNFKDVLAGSALPVVCPNSLGDPVNRPVHGVQLGFETGKPAPGIVALLVEPLNTLLDDYKLPLD